VQVLSQNTPGYQDCSKFLTNTLHNQPVVIKTYNKLRKSNL